MAGSKPRTSASIGRADVADRQGIEPLVGQIVMHEIRDAEDRRGPRRLLLDLEQTIALLTGRSRLRRGARA